MIKPGAQTGTNLVSPAAQTGTNGVKPARRPVRMHRPALTRKQAQTRLEMEYFERRADGMPAVSTLSSKYSSSAILVSATLFDFLRSRLLVNFRRYPLL